MTAALRTLFWSIAERFQRTLDRQNLRRNQDINVVDVVAGRPTGKYFILIDVHELC